LLDASRTFGKAMPSQWITKKKEKKVGSGSLAEERLFADSDGIKTITIESIMQQHLTSSSC
jgi:hypothetical protein